MAAQWLQADSDCGPSGTIAHGQKDLDYHHTPVPAYLNSSTASTSLISEKKSVSHGGTPFFFCVGLGLTFGILSVNGTHPHAPYSIPPSLRVQNAFCW
jgi:hypothetical protein